MLRFLLPCVEKVLLSMLRAVLPRRNRSCNLWHFEPRASFGVSSFALGPVQYELQGVFTTTASVY